MYVSGKYTKLHFPVPVLHQVVRFVQTLRREELEKTPGVAETLDWARALLYLGRERLDIPTIEETLGCVLKYKEDVVEGIENSPSAFVGLLGGANFGKLVVKVR